MESHFLDLQDPDGRSRSVPLDCLPYSIGRDTDNNLVLSKVSVSRHHATLHADGDTVRIVDNESRNGVLVNGERIRAGRRLRDGDLLRIGGVDLRFRKRPPQVPLAEEDTGTLQFFPHVSDPDLIASLTPETPPTAEEVGVRMSRPAYSSMLRLILEAPLPEMFETVFSAVDEATTFDRCLIILFEDGTPENLRILAQKTVRLRGPGPLTASGDVLVSRGVLRRVAEAREAVTVWRDDSRFVPTESFILSGAGAALCFPLVAQDRVLGVLYLDRMLGSPRFDQNSIDTLRPIVGVVALKVENYQLLDSYLSAQIHQRELDIAESVQRDFFPKKPPVIQGYEIDGHTRHCRQVGGDFYDHVLESGGILHLVMGDVSGKGLPSALYMVGVLSALRAHIQDGVELTELMNRLERYAAANFHADHFLTLFVGRLDVTSGRLLYCNAGHLPPVVVSSGGDVRELHGGDPALNLLRWEHYEQFEYQVREGDVLCVYTDGIVEEEAEDGVQFGLERLTDCLRAGRVDDLSALREGVFSRLETFSGASGPEDDKSLLLVRRADRRGCGKHGGSEGKRAEESRMAGGREIFRVEVASVLSERDRIIEEVLRCLESHDCLLDPFLDRLCLDEAISNAMIHGNGGDPGKRVTVRVLCSSDRWGVEIRDEGPGFDWQAVLRRIEIGIDPDDSSGRGVAILVRSGADVSFLDEGRGLFFSRPRG